MNTNKPSLLLLLLPHTPIRQVPGTDTTYVAREIFQGVAPLLSVPRGLFVVYCWSISGLVPVGVQGDGGASHTHWQIIYIYIIQAPNAILWRWGHAVVHELACRVRVGA